MSAEQCLRHAWLVRRQTQPSPMDVTKDNLRQFVERWNEHPNSPYILEHAAENGGMKLSESLNSLKMLSPSPCASLASSVDSDNAFTNGNDSYNCNGIYVPIDHIRRSSDSSCVVKGIDITERLNLAQEIRKLSDKLFQLSTIPTTFLDTGANFGNVPKNTKDISTGNSTSNIKLATLPRDHPASTECKIPWRRSSKNRINNMSRDVPLVPKNSSTSFREQFKSRLSMFKSGESNRSSSDESPNNTKDLLLQLLDQWDGPRGTKFRHSSVSTEFTTEDDSLGQRTISSINSFFQSRASGNKLSSSKNT